MNAHLSDVRNGGAIYYKDGKAKEFSKPSSRPQVVTLTAADGETIAKDLRDHHSPKNDSLVKSKQRSGSHENGCLARSKDSKAAWDRAQDRNYVGARGTMVPMRHLRRGVS